MSSDDNLSDMKSASDDHSHAVESGDGEGEDQAFFDAREGPDKKHGEQGRTLSENTSEPYTSLSNFAGLYSLPAVNERMSRGSNVSSLSECSQDTVNDGETAQVTNSGRGGVERPKRRMEPPQGPEMVNSTLSLQPTPETIDDSTETPSNQKQRPSSVTRITNASPSSPAPKSLALQQKTSIESSSSSAGSSSSGASDGYDTPHSHSSRAKFVAGHLSPSAAGLKRPSQVSSSSAGDVVHHSHSVRAVGEAAVPNGDSSSVSVAAAAGGGGAFVSTLQSLVSSSSLDEDAMSRDLATSSGDGDHDWRMGSSSPTDKSYGGDRDRDSRDHRDHRDSIGINIYDAMFGTSTPPTKSIEATARTVKTGTKEYFGDPVNVTVVGGGMDDAESEFKNKTRLVQTLNFHVGAIWTLKFSPDGRFIATGGQDCKVVVWSIGLPPSVSSLNSRKESEASESEHSGDEGGRFTPRHSNFSADGHGISIGRLSSASDKAGMQPFIWPTPFRIFIGHTKDVIDVSWSKSNFVLSASADRNVRLWHVSRDECLQFFRHPDIVTSLDFHPTQDRYFVSGCMDRRLRVWDIIPDAKVKEWASLNEKVTSVSFSPDGLTVAGGLMNGQVYFYIYDGLKFATQMYCRNRRGKFREGTKVTGMTFYQTSDAPPPMVTSPAQKRVLPPLLVTTNDNRVRLYSLSDYSLKSKYRGLKNTKMQIKATFSEDASYIISGSEVGLVHLWKTNIKPHAFLCGKPNTAERTGTNESFQSTTGPDVPAVVAVFAPSASIVQSCWQLHEALPASPILAHQSSSDSSSPAPNSPFSYPSSPSTVGGGSASGGKGGGGGGGGLSSSGKSNMNSNNNNSSTPPPISVDTKKKVLPPDLGTRVIVTADMDGCIRVFVRTT